MSVLPPFSPRDYLRLGYAPWVDPSWRRQPWANVPSLPAMSELSLHDLISRAGNALEDAVGEGLGPRNIVHLSGGNDSRAILAAILKNCDTRSVVAVTYGSPRTYDYEIPATIARRAGVEHIRIDLASHVFTSAQLVAVASEFVERPIWLFGPLMNRVVTTEFGHDQVYWSGYLGGAVTGCYAPAVGTESNDWGEAVRRLAMTSSFAQADRFLPPYDRAGLPGQTRGFSFSGPLTLDEQVYLVMRQHPWMYREHIVAGHNHRTPLCDKRFLEVVFNVGAELRYNQTFYLKFLESRYPRLFVGMPHKDHSGLHPKASAVRRSLRLNQLRARRQLGLMWPRNERLISPSVNHIDWDYAFRYRRDFAQMAEELLPSLREREVVPDLDPVQVLHGHLRREFDAGLFLTNLLSLEIYMQARVTGG